MFFSIHFTKTLLSIFFIYYFPEKTPHYLFNMISSPTNVSYAPIEYNVLDNMVNE